MSTAECLVLFLVVALFGARTTVSFGVNSARTTTTARREGASPLLLHAAAAAAGSRTTNRSPESDEKHVSTILFVECGFGSDAHGQNATKAAVRACRNAIEFNQIPSIAEIVPGGRGGMKLDVLLAVPAAYRAGLDVEAVKRCFPYGDIRVQLQDGGMVCSSGKMIAEMGDTINDDMLVVCVAVTVGY